MRHEHAIAIAVIWGALLAAPACYADDFQEVMAHVNATHPALQAEREGVEATQEGEHEAYAGFFPTATTDFARGRQDIKFNATPSADQDIRSKNLTVTQPIFSGGETVARVRASQHRTTAAEARYSQVHQQVLLSAITAYANMREKAELLSLTQANVKSLQELLTATRKQFKAAEVTVTDVSQSEARLARATAELHDAEAALEDARAAYVRDVGREPEVKTLPPLPAQLPQSAREIEEMLAAHPAIAEAQASEKVAEYTVDERFATILPDVNLQGQINDIEGSTLPTVFTRKDRSVVVRVSVPLYQSGAEYARLRQAKHQYQQARSQTQDVSRDARKTALREWNNHQAAAKAIAEHTTALTAGDKALKAVRAEQQAGTRTIIDVLNEQDSHYQTQVNLLRAETRHCLSAYRLLVAVGQLKRVFTDVAGHNP